MAVRHVISDDQICQPPPVFPFDQDVGIADSSTNVAQEKVHNMVVLTDFYLERLAFFIFNSLHHKLQPAYYWVELRVGNADVAIGGYAGGVMGSGDVAFSIFFD